MRDEDRQKIEEIMSGMKCPKNFRCADHGFEMLCKGKDFGVERYIDCLEKDAFKCPFAVSFGGSFLCQCPLRVYLAKKLKK